MSYPVVLAYHPQISSDKICRGTKYKITGNLKEYMDDDDIINAINMHCKSLKPVDILNRLKEKLTIPEGELWLVD